MSFCLAQHDNFDKIQIGDEAEIVHKITRQDLDTFLKLTGDDNAVNSLMPHILNTDSNIKIVAFERYL
ncbi:MAG: hypothetical protein RBU23_08155 [Candidatus Auribacterota bacterium]|jgi:hypothetical protein|nr:hypothetical protein [Candidatus Auribacterota bacterium]